MKIKDEGGFLFQKSIMQTGHYGQISVRIVIMFFILRFFYLVLITEAFLLMFFLPIKLLKQSSLTSHCDNFYFLFSSISVSPSRRTRQYEKDTLSNLNDRLAVYIDLSV